VLGVGAGAGAGVSNGVGAGVGAGVKGQVCKIPSHRQLPVKPIPPVTTVKPQSLKIPCWQQTKTCSESKLKFPKEVDTVKVELAEIAPLGHCEPSVVM